MQRNPHCRPSHCQAHQLSRLWPQGSCNHFGWQKQSIHCILKEKNNGTSFKCLLRTVKFYGMNFCTIVNQLMIKLWYRLCAREKQLSQNDICKRSGNWFSRRQFRLEWPPIEVSVSEKLLQISPSICHFWRVCEQKSQMLSTIYIQSLRKAIIFVLFYYINGYFRVYLADIHEYSFKMQCLPIILINFSWAKSHNFFIMEKSKFTLIFNIC